MKTKPDINIEDYTETMAACTRPAQVWATCSPSTGGKVDTGLYP